MDISVSNIHICIKWMKPMAIRLGIYPFDPDICILNTDICGIGFGVSIGVSVRVAQNVKVFG